MPHPPAAPRHLIGDRVAIAKTHTEQVQQDIARAEDQAHEATRVITDKLTQGTGDAELAAAASHTGEVEAELREARAELQVVTELLESEERDRKQLEAALVQARKSQVPPSGARSGEGSGSVIEHLRELTRHRLNSDSANAEVPRAAPAAGTGLRSE